jgi:hypothetical protein
MSVTNCCMIGDLISQNLSLIAPSIPSAVQYQCKSNSFPVCLKSVFLVRNMSLSCQNKSNSFCYICSEVVLKSQRKSLSELVRKAYELYFGCEVGDDKLGRRRFARAHVQGLWQVCCKVPTVSAFCCSDDVKWASRLRKGLLFFVWPRSPVSPDLPSVS